MNEKKRDLAILNDLKDYLKKYNCKILTEHGVIYLQDCDSWSQPVERNFIEITPEEIQRRINLLYPTQTPTQKKGGSGA